MEEIAEAMLVGVSKLSEGVQVQKKKVKNTEKPVNKRKNNVVDHFNKKVKGE